MQLRASRNPNPTYGDIGPFSSGLPFTYSLTISPSLTYTGTCYGDLLLWLSSFPLFIYTVHVRVVIRDSPASIPRQRSSHMLRCRTSSSHHVAISANDGDEAVDKELSQACLSSLTCLILHAEHRWVICVLSLNDNRSKHLPICLVHHVAGHCQSISAAAPVRPMGMSSSIPGLQVAGAGS